MSNKYKRGLLGFGGGMHSTEWHSSWCQDPLTSLLKLKWYKYRVDLIEISDCKLNLFPHSEWQRCNNQLINRSIDKPVYRFIFQAKMTNFRYFSVRICWLLDPLTFPPAPPTCQISCLHACLSSAAWKSRILCTLFNFRCLILHFLHPVCSAVCCRDSVRESRRQTNSSNYKKPLQLWMSAGLQKDKGRRWRVKL